MGPESHPATTAPFVRGPLCPADKLRLRFRKAGTLRLLSHHDLLRTFERMLRRAALPFRSSQGFHPKPRIIFALSLPLGVIGLEEVAELELDERLPLEEVRDRLARQAPPGLTILSLERIDIRAQAQVRRLCYRMPLPKERVPDLTRRAAEVLVASQCWIERTRPPARRVDLRPFISDLRIVDWPGYSADDGGAATGIALEMELWLTPSGTARPEELLSLLSIADVLDGGAVLERCRLELLDESSAPASPVPAIGLATRGGVRRGNYSSHPRGGDVLDRVNAANN